MSEHFEQEQDISNPQLIFPCINEESKSLPNCNSIITPPITPNVIREKTDYSHHSSDLSHSSIHAIVYPENPKNNLQKILNTEIQIQEDNTNLSLSEFCDSIMIKKFRQSIQNNIILPTENDKKIITLKIPTKYKNYTKISDKILDSIKYSDPKIVNFISNTIELVITQQIKIFNRYITSLENNSFVKISINSKLNKSLITNYYKMDVTILSINFL